MTAETEIVCGIVCFLSVIVGSDTKDSYFLLVRKHFDPLYPHFGPSEWFLYKLLTPCFSRHLTVPQSD